MKICRSRYDNVPESPVRTLYGRKGNLLLLPLDICILQVSNGIEEFRPPTEPARLIAAPIQEMGVGRLGVIAQYEWPPQTGAPVNPVVTVQLAPSANVKGVPDLRMLASQFRVGDRVFLTSTDANNIDANNIENNLAPTTPVEEVLPDVFPAAGERIEGTVALPGWHNYPDLAHRVMAYSVEFEQHVDRTVHGAAVWRETVEGETAQLLGMLILTQNESNGVCRALVYPA